MRDNKTAILVTAYCGGNDPEFFSNGTEEDNQLRHHMARTLASYLKKTNYYICYSSHSALDVELQKHCNSFVYDADNSWQINSLPRRPNHGVAEMTAIVNGLMMLKIKGFEQVLKLSYDQTPTINYEATIERCQKTNKKMATYEAPTDYGMMSFFGNIDFIIDTLPLDQLWRCEGAVERAWKERIVNDGLQSNVHGFKTYEEMFDVPRGTIYHYSIYGTLSKYDFT